MYDAPGYYVTSDQFFAGINVTIASYQEYCVCRVCRPIVMKINVQ